MLEFCIGLIIGLLVEDALFMLFKREKTKNNVEVKADKGATREAPQNISSISDPLESYNRYKDGISKLYRPIKREVVNRLEIGNNDDSK